LKNDRFFSDTKLVWEYLFKNHIQKPYIKKRILKLIIWWLQKEKWSFLKIV